MTHLLLALILLTTTIFCSGQSQVHTYSFSEIEITQSELKKYLDEYIVPSAKQDNLSSTNDLIEVDLSADKAIIRVSKDLYIGEAYDLGVSAGFVNWWVYLSDNYPILVLTSPDCPYIYIKPEIYMWKRFRTYLINREVLFTPFIWWFFTIHNNKLIYKDTMFYEPPWTIIKDLDNTIIRRDSN